MTDEPDLSGFDNLEPAEIDYLDDHCHETGAPGRDRARALREQAQEQHED